MTFTPSWWAPPGGPPVFYRAEADVPKGYAPCAGHYDAGIGQWISDEPKDDLPVLRATYKAVFGKKPFGAWDAATLRQKLA